MQRAWPMSPKQPLTWADWALQRLAGMARVA